MPRSLTQFLENSGRISARQIEEARRSQRFFGGSLLYNLVRLKVLPEPDAQEMLAQWMGYPYAPLQDLKTIPQQVLRLIQHGAIARRRVLPFKPENDRLFVATARIGNDPFFRDLQQRVGLSVVPHAIMEEHLEPLLELYYGIPAPSRETVRLAKVDNPLLGGTISSSHTAAPERGTLTEPEMGLDGLPINSDVAPSQLLPTDSDNPMALFDALDNIDDGAPGERQAPRRPAPVIEDGDAPIAGVASPIERLARARDRCEVGEAAVEQALSLGMVRVGLLGIRGDQMVGWHAGGDGVPGGSFQRLNLSLQHPSIFATFKGKAPTYCGTVPDLPANRDLITAMGGGVLPQQVLAVPVILKERTVAVLYADDGPGAVKAPDATGPLEELAGKLAASLEILLLRRKIIG